MTDDLSNAVSGDALQRAVSSAAQGYKAWIVADEMTCHTTDSGTALLDEYAIETPICCGLTFKAHDETVTDHVVDSRRLWNAQLHDMVDNIERQARKDQWYAGYDYGRRSWAPTRSQVVPWWRRVMWRFQR